MSTLRLTPEEVGLLQDALAEAIDAESDRVGDVTRLAPDHIHPLRLRLRDLQQLSNKITDQYWRDA